MANNKDDRITEILARYGEDLSATWMVQGTRVIYHKALERIATKAKVVFDAPQILRAEAEEAVILVTGRSAKVGDQDPRLEWSIGEARISKEGQPGNYRVTGKQAAYPYAMAEKRAKDRVILKLIELSGDLYSEEESDDFKQSAAGERREIMSDAISSGKPIELDDGVVHPGDALIRKINEQGTAIGIKNLMLTHEVQTYLSGIPQDQRMELRNIAISRMADLGWKREGKTNG
jgi:hypothetical protein